MKKYIVAFAMLTAILFPLQVQAASGSLEIAVPQNVKGTLLYVKVAVMENGMWKLTNEYEESKVNLNEMTTAKQAEQAAKTLADYRSGHFEKTDLCGETVMLNALEEGLYLLIYQTEEHMKIKPALVSLPGWNGENMEYDVKVFPKYTKEVPSPKTGDDRNAAAYMTGLWISFIFILGLACHRHFKCGKMFFKYSNIGGHTDGNDNDTKNPCCTRRIRQRSCRSVD